MRSSTLNRSFKTAKFARDANKAKITDLDLCLAIQQILLGQADDLGGGVFKKRLNNNQHRSILVAKSYAGLTAHQLGQLLINKDLLEICHDDKTEIQK